jgi:hypothetical protein
VEVHARSRQRVAPRRLRIRPEVAEEVRHGPRPTQGGGAEGEAADGAEELLELVGLAGLERDVPGVVRARRELVGQERPVTREEALHGHEPDRIEPLDDAYREAGGGRGDLVGDASRDDGDVEHVAVVGVLEGWEDAQLTRRAARDEHGELEREVDVRLEDARAAREERVRRGEVVRIVEPALALAVVAEAGRLEDGGEADARHRCVQRLAIRHEREGSDGDAEVGEEALLASAVLGDRQDRRVGTHRDVRGERRGRLCRDVLELERDDVDGGGESRQRLRIVVRLAHGEVSQREGRRVALRRPDGHAVAEASRGNGQHPTELSPAEDPDGGTGEDRGGGGGSPHGR